MINNQTLGGDWNLLAAPVLDVNLNPTNCKLADVCTAPLSIAFIIFVVPPEFF